MVHQGVHLEIHIQCIARITGLTSTTTNNSYVQSLVMRRMIALMGILEMNSHQGILYAISLKFASQMLFLWWADAVEWTRFA